MIFNCIHGRQSNACLICAQTATTEAVERQHKAVREQTAAAAERARLAEDRYQRQLREDAVAAARADEEARAQRAAERRREEAALSAQMAAEVDRQMAQEAQWDRHDRARSEQQEREEVAAQAAERAAQQERRVRRAVAVAQTKAMDEGRVLTPVEELDVREAAEEDFQREQEEMEAARSRAEAERVQAELAQLRAARAAEEEARCRQQEQEAVERREAADRQARRAAHEAERAALDKDYRERLTAYKKRRDERRAAVLVAAVSLALYAGWLDWHSVVSFAVAALVGSCVTVFRSDNVDRSRRRGDRYVNNAAVGVLTFIALLGLLFLLPWAHPTVLDWLLLAAAALTGASPLLYKYNEAPPVTRHERLSDVPAGVA